MPNRPALSLIAAVARNGAIGRDNALIWHESEDLKRLRRLTMGHPVIMGRRTWESLPPRFRPLPGRRNLVLTRDAAWRADGAEPTPSLDAALALVAGAERAFVLGGAAAYAQALPHVDRLELTEIDADFDGDTFFPAWDRAAFTVEARESHTGADGIGYHFVTYQRITGD
jgi:dihydrofolate reductase